MSHLFVKKGVLDIQLSKKVTVKYADGTQTNDFTDKPAEPKPIPKPENVMQKKEEKPNPKT